MPIVALLRRDSEADTVSGLTSARTTRSRSRSRWLSCSPASARCCAATSSRGRPAEAPRGARCCAAGASSCASRRTRCAALSRDTILERVWGYEFGGGTRTVDVHMRWLREKLERDPSIPRHLQTVRGVGYKFVP